MPHIFDRSGFAALSDIQNPRWQELFALLEKEQLEFLSREAEFRSPEYHWPRDPLHTWSRIWEYPYARHHLRVNRPATPSERLPLAVDVGSGVTFFPFSVARLGYRVSCTDVDPICAKDIPRAARVLSTAPGAVEFRLARNGCLPFEDDEADAVYCVSVLEHIPGFEKTIAEMARILKPGGLLILTIDLDLRGDAEIGVEGYRKLRAALAENFDLRFPEVSVHPRDVLLSSSGPFAFKPPEGLPKLWFDLKEGIKALLGKKPRYWMPFLLAVEGLVMVKKSGSE